MKTIEQIRADFPFLRQHPEITYLDSAATSLKPDSVLNKLYDFYSNYSTNIHRSTHFAAERATLAFELTRQKIAGFINADPNEIIFTPNATHGFNMLAQMLNLTSRDLVLGSVIDHHSNILPWKRRARYLALPVDHGGSIQPDRMTDKETESAKIMVINYVSNVTGKIQDIKYLINWAKTRNITSVIDASQAVCHLPIDVKTLGADFLIFSGHKMLGPSGVGILYGKYHHLASFTPDLLGGGMAHSVKAEETIYKPIPHRFEAGTPNIENVIALGAAVDYLESTGWQQMVTHQRYLSEYFLARIHQMKKLQLLSECHRGDDAPIFSMYPVSGGMDVQQIARILSDRYKILVTAGKQCAHPYYEFRNLPGGAIRISLSLYNNTDELDRLLSALDDITMFLPQTSTTAA